MNFKAVVCSVIKEKVEALYGIKLKELDKAVNICPQSTMGDYSFPCFQLVKQLGKSPDKIAEELAEIMQAENSLSWIDRVIAVKGYVNIYLNRADYAENVLSKAVTEGFGGSDMCKGQTICMDYSSPNIAKNFHVGHLRTTIIGNSLSKIFSKLGYSVVRINYLGDWGTQFGNLIAAYHRLSRRELVEAEGIKELMRIYVKFEQESEKNPELKEEGRNWFAKMEQGDEEAISIWEWFKEISLHEFDKVYQLLNITFDSCQGESFYMDKVPVLAEELRQKNLLEKSEGAEIVRLEEYGLPPCLIVKNNGSSIYHSRDIAAAIHRQETYHFCKCFYITGMEQKLHFTQVFKVLEKMEYEWAEGMSHIPYGLVSMGGQKLSSRKGNIIYAEEILQESIIRALAAIQEKSPDLENKEEAAKKIGIGAVVYHDLANQLIKDVQFKWEAVLNFDGMTAPYIQYTFARANSILKKVTMAEEIIDYRVLTDDISYEVIKNLGQYPDMVAEAAEKKEPCVIARYVYHLAVSFNKFYQDCRIIGEESGVVTARYCLTKAVAVVIEDAMALLGIECPDKM